MSTALVIALIAAGSAIGSAVISGIIGTALGSYLQRRGAEHEISFSRLHDRRASVIEELYKRAVEVKRTFPVWSEPGNMDRLNEKLGEMLEALEALTRYYEEHRIWLDDGSRERLDQFGDETLTLALDAGDLTLSDELAEYQGVTDIRERAQADPEYGALFIERFERQVEGRKKISADLDALIGGLDAEFRRLLRGDG